MRRLLILIGGVAAVVILSKLLIEDVLGMGLAPFGERWLAQAGIGSAVTVVVLLAADLFLPIPSSLIMILSGAAFGTLWGALFSFVGSVGGEWLGFELVRRYGRKASRLIVGDEDLGRLERVFDRHGLAVVMVTRALPVAMETTSVVAGLSGMSRGKFLLASFLGTAPIVFVYVYAGAISRQSQSIVPAVVILIALAGGAWIWLRARMTEQPAA